MQEALLRPRNATAAVVGAGDFVGAAIAKKFASEGFTVFAGRRKGEKLAPLVAEIEASGGRIIGRELGPKGIHIAHLVIDAGVDTAWVRERIKEREGEAALANLDPGRLMRPASVAEAYWQIYQEPRDAWSFEREI